MNIINLSHVKTWIWQNNQTLKERETLEGYTMKHVLSLNSMR